MVLKYLATTPALPAFLNPSRRALSLIACLTLLLCLAAGASSLLFASEKGEDKKQTEPGIETVKPVELVAVSGKPISPLVPGEGNRAAVLVFITTDCPIANSYAPELGRIIREYSEKGVKFTLVHVDPGLTGADATKHAEDYALTAAPLVIDRKHQLVRTTGASVTPEAAVIDSQGRLVYRGRIDDMYADYGDRRAHISDPTLRNALDAVLAGKAVTNARVTPLGCYIPEL